MTVDSTPSPVASVMNAGRIGRCFSAQLKTRKLETRNPNGVPPIVHEVLNSPGQSLDPATRAFFEPRFSHDFSGVRVHTDPRAAASARAMSALAYTVGNHIVFGPGQYMNNREGKRLLAHELTHTIQQSDVTAHHIGQTSQPSGVLEQQADEQANNTVSQETLERPRPAATGPEVACSVNDYRTGVFAAASNAGPWLVLRKQASETTLGIGITKTKEFFKRRKTAVTPKGIVTVSLVGSGTVTVSPETSNVTISDKEFNLELEKLGMSISVAPGKNNFTFSSKFGGLSPTVSTKISFVPPNKTIYSTENTVVSYKREGKKVEGTLNLEIITEITYIDRLKPKPAPEPIPWYLLLLAFVEEGGWVIVLI